MYTGQYHLTNWKASITVQNTKYEHIELFHAAVAGKHMWDGRTTT